MGVGGEELVELVRGEGVLGGVGVTLGLVGDDWLGFLRFGLGEVLGGVRAPDGVQLLLPLN